MPKSVRLYTFVKRDGYFLSKPFNILQWYTWVSKQCIINTWWVMHIQVSLYIIVVHLGKLYTSSTFNLQTHNAGIKVYNKVWQHSSKNNEQHANKRNKNTNFNAHLGSLKFFNRMNRVEKYPWHRDPNRFMKICTDWNQSFIFHVHTF